MKAESGFSLVAVAALGVVTMMWIFAISASVLPMFQRASVGRYTTVLRSSAEAGLDYAVSQLNSAIAAGTTATIDDGNSHSVPTGAVGNNGAGVAVVVAKKAPPGPPNASAIYLTPFNPATGSGFVNTGDWRLVTATATYAGMVKKIRVILEPSYQQTSTTSNQQVPYFSTFAILTQSYITMTGNANTDSYYSYPPKADGSAQTTTFVPYGATIPAGLQNAGQANLSNVGGDIGTEAYPRVGTPISLSGNTVIGGSVDVFSNQGQPSSSTDSTATGNVKVNDLVTTNGTVSGLTAYNPDTGTGNVYGMDPNPPANLVQTGQSNLGPSIAPAMSVPSTDTVINGSVTKSGNTYTVAQPAPGQAANLGSLSISGNSVYHIKPGDYEISSLSITGNGQLVVDPGTSGYGAVRFFVGGTTSGASAIQISGNGIANNSNIASDLQFWYGGSKNVSFSGNANFTGIVYAPNASMAVTGNGSVYGAMVGLNLSDTGNGSIHYDKSLYNNANAFNLTYSSTVTTNQLVLQALQAITWQEPRSFAEEQNW